jgi:hypothetical protein
MLRVGIAVQQGEHDRCQRDQDDLAGEHHGGHRPQSGSSVTVTNNGRPTTTSHRTNGTSILANDGWAAR